MIEFPENISQNKIRSDKDSRIILHLVGISIAIFSTHLIINYLSKKKQNVKIKKAKNKKSDEKNTVNQDTVFVLEKIKKLAKNNDPIFLVKFLEIYPKFQCNIEKNRLNLQNSELTLLVYIYLNFTTKEIASCTFKSVKTIQNRKHLLRKKLNILPHEDFYVWLKKNCI